MVELTRLLFLSTKLEFTPIFLELCPGGTHTFIAFKRQGSYYIFEHSFNDRRGIHGPFRSISQLVNTMVQWSYESLWNGIDVGLRYCTYHPIMRSGITSDEYMNIARNARRVPHVLTTDVMFHASPVQGLRKLDPTRSVKSPGGGYDGLIYVTPEICFAAGFCISFSEREGFVHGRHKLIDPRFYYMHVPKQYAHRLDQPASIYLVENKNVRRCGHNLPEYVSDQPFKVIKELKFTTARECMTTYGVQIVIK